MSIRRICSLVGFVVALAACGGDTDAPTAPTAVSPASSLTIVPETTAGRDAVLSSALMTASAGTVRTLTVSADSTTLRVGATVVVRASAFYSDGTSQYVDPEWGSSDSAVASVTKAGVVTAHTVGTTLIVATFEGQSGSLSITVRPTLTISRLVVTPGTPAIRVGQTTTMTAVAHYTNGSTEQVTPEQWSSNNLGVATVTGNGLVTGVALGTVRIKAKYQGKSPSVRMRVVSLSSLVLSVGDRSLRTGQTATIKATARYSDGSTERVTPAWSSNNPGVATVSESGKVTAVAVGTARIKASYGGKNPSIRFTVVSLSSVKVTVGQRNLRVGQTTTAKATARYSDGSTERVTPKWSSTNRSVVTVSSSGKVRAVAPGSAQIKARYSGKNPAVGITVTRAPMSKADIVLTGQRFRTYWAASGHIGYTLYFRNRGSGCAKNFRWRLRTWEYGGGSWSTRGPALDNVIETRQSSYPIRAGQSFTGARNNLIETGKYWRRSSNPIWWQATFWWTSIYCSDALTETGARTEDQQTGGQSQSEEFGSLRRATLPGR